MYVIKIIFLLKYVFLTQLMSHYYKKILVCLSIIMFFFIGSTVKDAIYTSNIK